MHTHTHTCLHTYRDDGQVLRQPSLGFWPRLPLVSCVILDNHSAPVPTWGVEWNHGPLMSMNIWIKGHVRGCCIGTARADTELGTCQRSRDYRKWNLLLCWYSSPSTVHHLFLLPSQWEWVHLSGMGLHQLPGNTGYKNSCAHLIIYIGSVEWETHLLCRLQCLYPQIVTSLMEKHAAGKAILYSSIHLLQDSCFFPGWGNYEWNFYKHLHTSFCMNIAVQFYWGR